jgi:hypothetical protein
MLPFGQDSTRRHAFASGFQGWKPLPGGRARNEAGILSGMREVTSKRKRSVPLSNFKIANVGIFFGFHKFRPLLLESCAGRSNAVGFARPALIAM